VCIKEKSSETNLKTVYVSLGSNQSGDCDVSKSFVKSAYRLLAQKSIIIDECSPFYETPAFPAGSGPNYVNTVIKARTSLSPDAMLQVLHSVEAELGRARSKRWEARVIDIDILDYEGVVLPDLQTHKTWRDMPLEQQLTIWPDGLILPHPRIQDRAFVLVPLRTIAPDWVHPVTKETIDVLLGRLPPQDLETVVVISDC